MNYATDRKRAVGLGSAKEGTHHFWSMQVSSIALALLIPLFIFTFGRILGAPHDEVVAYFSRPFPALVAAGTIAVGFMHFKNGVRVMIEDYTGGLTRKYLIIGTIIFSYAAAATGLYAIARIAL